MKAIKTNRLWMGILAMVALLVCSCEEKNGTDTPIFPTEVTSFSVVPGDTIVVAFTANADWQLSSNATWCKVGGFLDTTGKAGKQQVIFTIGADGQSVDEDKADISLRMGDESKVIAVVTRAGISNAIVLGNDSVDYVHGQTLVIGTDGMASLVIKDITFDANNLYISTTAEWLDIQRDDTIFTFTVKEEFLKYTQTNATDSICFSNKKVPMMRLNVQYTGMDAEAIILEPATLWGVRVSADGTTYRRPSLEIAAEETAAPMVVNVTARNDLYTLYYANYDKKSCVLVDATESWIVAEDDRKGTVSISFKENTASERVGYLLVLPNGIVDTFSDETMISDFLFEDNEGTAVLKAECEQYLIAELIQESTLASSFHLIDGPTFEYMDIALETDEMYVAFAESNGVSANNLFKAELEFAHPYLFNPMLPLDTWDPSTENGGTISVFNIATGEYAVEGEDYLIEPTMMEAEGDYMLLQFRSYIENDYIIFFVDGQKVYHKALVVTVKL